MNAVHPLQTSSRRWLPLQPAEWALLVAAAALLAFAVWGPFLPASAHQHDFADQRGWQGLPCALDVLSNLPFAVVDGVARGAGGAGCECDECGAGCA